MTGSIKNKKCMEAGVPWVAVYVFPWCADGSCNLCLCPLNTLPNYSAVLKRCAHLSKQSVVRTSFDTSSLVGQTPEAAGKDGPQDCWVPANQWNSEVVPLHDVSILAPSTWAPRQYGLDGSSEAVRDFLIRIARTWFFPCNRNSPFPIIWSPAYIIWNYDLSGTLSDILGIFPCDWNRIWQSFFIQVQFFTQTLPHKPDLFSFLESLDITKRRIRFIDIDRKISIPRPGETHSATFTSTTCAQNRIPGDGSSSGNSQFLWWSSVKRAKLQAQKIKILKISLSTTSKRKYVVSGKFDGITKGIQYIPGSILQKMILLELLV